MTTNYSEAAYFDGYHFQHIAAWMERVRIERLRREGAAILKGLGR